MIEAGFMPVFLFTQTFMNEPFALPVTYKGIELLFPARLLVLCYTHKFQIEVNGQEVFFEPDEERNYRAVIDPEQMKNSKIDVGLLKAITSAIEAIVN